MNKLLWVSLPLLAFALWLAWRALRGRMPPRLALNVLTSVLLLAYLSVTAGLGIFWVANQHLPVFDWHYLFGYLTIALLLIHLGFNARIVWRWLTQPKLRQGAAPVRAAESAAAAGVARRWVTLGGALALGSASAFAYWLGLRHGKTQLIIGEASPIPAAKPSPSPGTAPGLAHANPATTSQAGRAEAVVRQFHEFSGHSRSGLFRRAPSVSWGGQPDPFRPVARGATTLALPRARGNVAASDRSPNSSAETLQALADVLWHVAGISLESGGIAFRTSPSSGALFATELYVLALGSPQLAAQWWRYDAQAHRLVAHTPARDPKPWIAAGADALQDVWVIASAVFARSGHKYRDRTYRYVLADLGHALENLDLAARARGWAAQWPRSFDESGLAQMLGLDESQEGVLAVARLGDATAQRPAAPMPQFAPAPLSAALGPLGVTNAIHLATSLRAAGSSPSGNALTARQLVAANQPSHAAPARSCALMASRRSVRRFASKPLPQAQLRVLMQATQYSGAAMASQAVRGHVLAHAVDGLPLGAWHWQGHSAAAEGSGQVWRPAQAAPLSRSASLRAGLDRDVIGDAAAVVIFSVLVPLLAEDPDGFARGYRHAFLEAGHRGERLYLEAQARGIACCGVGAFYDDEANKILGLDPTQHWITHFVALGWPS